MSIEPPPDLLGITVKIVTSHVANNLVEASALPTLIRSVYQTLSSVDDANLSPTTTQRPAVLVKKSVFPDFIVCLEDGKKLKMLKRHLQTSYGMTPNDYRIKWSLPPDYPMVAPNYATTRSSLAKSMGLGRKPTASLEKPAELADPDELAATQLPSRRARSAKS